MDDMTSKLVLPQDFVAFCEALEPSFRRMMSVHQLRFFWEREQALRQDVKAERAALLEMVRERMDLAVARVDAAKDWIEADVARAVLTALEKFAADIDARGDG